MIFDGSGQVPAQSLLMLLFFVTAVVQLLLTVEDIVDRRYGICFFDGGLLLGELCWLGFLITGRGAAAEGLAARTVLCWLIGAVLAGYALGSYGWIFWDKKHRLSRESIKEGSDNLPDGICFFGEDGAVRLMNRRMLSAGIMLFGKEIQTLEELHQALRRPPATVECLDAEKRLYRFPNGDVLRFAEKTFTDVDGSRVTEVAAANVTELYEKQQELNRENQRLAVANGRLKQMMDNMYDIVREKEILSLKMRIHDDIGHSILSARKALLGQQDLGAIRENAALWEKALTILDQANRMPETPDEWETMEKQAGELGLAICLDGALPEDAFARHLLILSVRECATNCVRHAGGDRLFLSVSSEAGHAVWVITNNGQAPAGAAREGGGLSGLRRRLEQEGGAMEITWAPRFALKVTIPLKEDVR